MPTDDPSRECLLKFEVASTSNPARKEFQLQINIQYKRNNVFKYDNLLDLPISFDQSEDLDKLKGELKDELTARSCNKKNQEAHGSVEFEKKVVRHTGTSFDAKRSNEVLSSK